MKRPRILKLGWEFPPLINGGLGVACLGLSRALSRQVDLEVIVPKCEAGASFDGFRLTGMAETEVRVEREVEYEERYEGYARVERVPVALDPYGGGEPFEEVVRMVPAETRKVVRRELERIERFEIGELYGGDLGEKVWEFSKIVAELAKGREFDLVHAHDWMTYQAGVEVKRATGRPLVVHVHASQYDRAGADARGWIYDIEKQGMEVADRVIPVSRYTGEICAGHYGIDEGKIRPVHNGADPVQAYRTEKDFPEALVLFLGRLTAQKGPEFFLEIASRVLERNPKVRFVMAGTGERLRPLIESGAFRGLGGHFHFTGFLNKSKVRELLSMTDIYCMPSVSEPFGLSALEAAQFGIPAVISKQSGCAEVLKGALVADFWDTELMARHIGDLIADEDLRGRVVEQAARDIASSTWDAAAGKVFEVYRELLN